MMSERRINPSSLTGDEMQRLKQVAGLIGNLSYREMRFLAGTLAEQWLDCEVTGTEGMANSLLATIQKIYETKELPK